MAVTTPSWSVADKSCNSEYLHHKCAPRSKCSLFSPFSPFISCDGVICCLVFCLWFPLNKSQEQKTVNLFMFYVAAGQPVFSPYLRASTAKAHYSSPWGLGPTRKGRERRLSCLEPVNPSVLSLSRVCFLSWWHMLCSSTTRSSGKQLPPKSNGPF